MLADVIDVLMCPHCQRGLQMFGGTVRCDRGHSFDVARHGYVSLLPGDAHTKTGDTSAMVQARNAFLGKGYYAPIAQALRDASAPLLTKTTAGVIADVGAGVGYYLAAVLEHVPACTGLALDVSKHALRHAAKVHPRIGAVVCDAWRPLPVRSGTLALVLNVFAPRNGGEIHRILHPDGALLVVTPTQHHLHELIAALDLLTVDERKAQRLEEKLGPWFSLESQQEKTFMLSLDHAAIELLVAMGPSAWHTESAQRRERIDALPSPVTVTASFTLSVYRPRSQVSAG